MKILQCHLGNFGSYKKLHFDFTNPGLNLIYGPTGSGKSTLCDAIPWVLFGRTAKNGAVNEVIGWNGDGSTLGTIRLEDKGQMWEIFRLRGKVNDFYFKKYGPDMDYDPGPTRGKDTNDTQRMLNDILGLSLDLYLSGAYFHEFSQTAQFFTTSAKNRRSICEQIVDLSLAVDLQEKLKEKEKYAKNQLIKLETNKDKIEYKINHLQTYETNRINRSNEWVKNKEKLRNILEINCDNFEISKVKNLKKLELAYKQDLKKLRTATVCSECGSSKPINNNAESLIARDIEYEKSKENNYLLHLAELEMQTNPYAETKDLSELDDLESVLEDISLDIVWQNQQVNDLSLLRMIVDDFRSTIVKTRILEVQNNTNKLLNDHFDSEIKVIFEVEEADKLEVSILKDGNLCVYTQLSKGQRQLLKLCFSLAIMTSIQNHNGIKFNQIFFDEALDGLDGEFKVKALGLLKSLELEYESIFLVEHASEIKALCDSCYEVSLVNGESQIEEAF